MYRLANVINLYINFIASLTIVYTHFTESKATHNMKMEMARLQNANAQMELLLTKASNESIEAKQSHTSRILHLESEREIIVNNIKHIEMAAAGDSGLVQDQSSLEQILTSLDRIKKHIDANNSALEQTILKVQTSSQLLLSKADEAKKIVEKEKQKIINEKEEAIADRFKMEKQLLDLKNKLEKQANHDKAIIKDLEGEILNQKLIIDKINKSTQNYISKLEEEMQSLQNLYQNSLARISDLQDKLSNMTSEKANHENIIHKVQEDLEQKSKEVALLQNELEKIKNKPKIDFAGQAGTSKENFISESSQTDKINYADKMRYNDTPNAQKIEEFDALTMKKSKDVRPKQIPQSFNEVQILTANIEPTFDFVKNTYLTYKLKQLSTCRLEHYSISSFENNLTDQNLVDIYNRQSDIHTVSSKAMVNLDEENSKQPTTVASEDLSNPFIPTSEESTDKDIFLIYQDSDDSRVEKDFDNKDKWPHVASSSQPDVNTNKIAKLRMRTGPQVQNEPSDIQKHPGVESYDIDSIQDRKQLKTQPSEGQDNKTAAKNYQYKIASPPKSKTVRYSDDVPGVIEKEPNDDTDLGANSDAYNLRGYNADSTDNKSSPKKNIYAEDDDKSRYIQADNYTPIQKIEAPITSELKKYPEDKLSKFPRESSKTKHINHEVRTTSLPSKPLRNDSSVEDTGDHKTNKYSNDYDSKINNNDNYASDVEDTMIGPTKLRYKKDNSHKIKNIQNNDFSMVDAEDSKLDLHTSSYSQNYRAKNVEDDEGIDISDQNQYFKNKKPVVTRTITSSDSNKNDKSHHQLSRVGADVLVFKNEKARNTSPPKSQLGSFGLEYILNTVKQELEPSNSKPNSYVRRTRSDDIYNMLRDSGVSEFSPVVTTDKTISSLSGSPSNRSPSKSVTEQSIMVNIDPTEDYENKIRILAKTLENIERDYKKKIDAIKVQYDSHIKSIINEHNQGVKSIQGLHEETLQDIIKIHENEAESLRSMSIEHVRKAEKLEKENRLLKSKLQETCKFSAEASIVFTFT